VVSSAARTSSPDQSSSTMSGTAKPSVTTVASFGVDVGHRSSGAGSATGTCLAVIFASATFTVGKNTAQKLSEITQLVYNSQRGAVEC